MIHISVIFFNNLINFCIIYLMPAWIFTIKLAIQFYYSKSVLRKFKSIHPPINDAKTKTAIQKRVKQIQNPSTYVKRKVEFIASQTRAQNIIRRASSRKRAATNLENKIAHSTNVRDLFASFFHGN